MDLDRNSVDGARAMDEETLRHMEQELVQSNPGLRYSPRLREMALAIQKGSQAGWRPSEAVRGDGQLHDSDVNKENMDGFFGDMGGFRKREMVSPETLGATADLEDERYFGEETTSPGQEWLKRIETSHAEPRPIEENQPNQQEMERQGQPPRQAPWLRHYPAAGRFAARRTR